MKKKATNPTDERLRQVTPSGRRDADFFQAVYSVVREIPAGRVTTYGAIAKALGTAKAARTVGWALNGAHLLTPAVPAHRVVNRLGMLSGKVHFAPPERMQQALEREGVAVEEDRVRDFEKLFWDPAGEM